MEIIPLQAKLFCHPFLQDQSNLYPNAPVIFANNIAIFEILWNTKMKD